MSVLLRYRVCQNSPDPGTVLFDTDRMSIPPVIPARGDVLKSESQGRDFLQLVAKRKRANLWVPADTPGSVIFDFHLAQKEGKTIDLSIKLLKGTRERRLISPGGPLNNDWRITETVLAVVNVKGTVERFVPVAGQTGRGYVASLAAQ